jgi:hypothetical protein
LGFQVAEHGGVGGAGVGGVRKGAR